MLTIGERISPATVLEFIPASRLREWKQLQTMPDVCLYNKVKNSEREQSAFSTNTQSWPFRLID